MQGMPEEELNGNLLGSNLSGQATQTGFIFVCWHTDHELFTEILGELLFEAKCRLIVDAAVGREGT
jgi:hypothetical protein